jgi:hypothetical protein
MDFPLPPMNSNTNMIAFQLEYVIEPDRVDDFRTYARHFVELTKKYGGEHYGYFVDTGGEKTTALAVFAFSNIDRYDSYRRRVLDDLQYEQAMDLAKRTKCIKTCNRTVYDRQIA